MTDNTTLTEAEALRYRPPHPHRRPKALPAHEALELIERESNLVAIEAARLANGHPITDEIKSRLLRAAAAIHHARQAST